MVSAAGAGIAAASATVTNVMRQSRKRMIARNIWCFEGW